MSGWMIFLWNNLGMSCKKIGIASERPSATDFLTFAAMNRDTDLKMYSNSIIEAVVP